MVENNNFFIKINIGGQTYDRKMSIESLDNFKRLEMFEKFSVLVDKILAKYIPKKKKKE